MSSTPLSYATYKLLLLGCLASFFALAVNFAIVKSPTLDEPVHVVRAIALHDGNFCFSARASTVEPPLDGHFVANGIRPACA